VIFSRIDSWVERRLTVVGSAVIALVILLYVVSQFVPDISQWIITRGFFSVILIVLIIDLLHRVIELKGEPPSLEAYEDQAQAMPQIQEFIEKERPETSDLLEYSTSSTRSLLQELRKANVRIRLLICHPDNAVSAHERRTIELGIENLRKDFKDYGNITIKQYRTPASLRGRNIGGKWINVGWYLYSNMDGEVDIRGHDVAMILSDVNTPQGKKLKAMFSWAFDALWQDSTTEELVITPEVQASADRVSDLPRLRPRRSS
jgi:hypothetical protein